MVQQVMSYSAEAADALKPLEDMPTAAMAYKTAIIKSDALL